MSHEITIQESGKAEFAYTGEAGWHGLGNELPEGASIEQWQEAAGMMWKVQRSKVRFFADAAGTEQHEWADNHVLFRSDNKLPLGLVSPGYKIVQPKAVIEFFRDLVGGNGYTLDTAGTLYGGKKFWALAKVASACVQGDDRVNGYLLLSTSADGSSATEVRECAIRVVCKNTLAMAQSAGSKNTVKISHRTRFDDKSLKAKMTDSLEHFHAFMDSARDLSTKQVTNAVAENFVRELLRPAKEVAAAATAIVNMGGSNFASLLNKSFVPSNLSLVEDEKRAPRGEAEILNLFRGNAIGSGLAGTNGTAWQLVNACTEYVDHKKTAKSDSHRLDSALFGDGDALKTRAFELARAL
jgi:phage/plasmid-like protein (TIGR03299 family)